MKQIIGSDLSFLALCTAVLMTGLTVAPVTNAEEEKAPAAANRAPGGGDPDRQAWDAASQRLEGAFKKYGGGPLPDDDPQMRDDFLTLARLDPAGALEVLTLHPLKSRFVCFGILRYTLCFYVPGLQEIGRSSPEMLANWLSGLEDEATHSSNVYSDGAEALAGYPGELAKLMGTKTYNTSVLVESFVRGSLDRREMPVTDLVERLRNARQLRARDCDQILALIARTKGKDLGPEAVADMLATARSSGAQARILARVLSQTTADDPGVSAMLSQVSPDLALAALCDGSLLSTYPETEKDSFCVRHPDSIEKVLLAATPARAMEQRGDTMFTYFKIPSPEKAATYLHSLPDSEWKQVLSHQISPPSGPANWPETYRTQRALTNEQGQFVNPKLSEIGRKKGTAAMLEEATGPLRGLLFSIGVERALNIGGDDQPGDWTEAAKVYAGTASMVAPGDRVMAAKDFSRAMAADSPEAAVVWFAALTGTEERAEAAKGIVEGWSALDADAAARWLATVKDPEAKKAGAAVLVDQLTGGDTPMRQEWQRIAEGG
jgi:hypothetical protein